MAEVEAAIQEMFQAPHIQVSLIFSVYVVNNELGSISWPHLSSICSSGKWHFGRRFQNGQMRHVMLWSICNMLWDKLDVDGRPFLKVAEGRRSCFLVRYQKTWRVDLLWTRRWFKCFRANISARLVKNCNSQKKSYCYRTKTITGHKSLNNHWLIECFFCRIGRQIGFIC